MSDIADERDNSPSHSCDECRDICPKGCGYSLRAHAAGNPCPDEFGALRAWGLL